MLIKVCSIVLCPHWWFFVSGENLRKLKFHLTGGLVFKHTCTICCHSSHRLTKRDGQMDGCILYRYTVYTLNQVSLERRYFHSNWWQRRKTERLHWGSRGRFLQHLGMQLLTNCHTDWYDPDDVVRYADLAAGKKVRAPAETELSEKEMKYLLLHITVFFLQFCFLFSN